MANLLDRWFDTKKNKSFQQGQQINDAVERYENELLSMQDNSSIQNFEYSPACDIDEEEDFYSVKVDLPGVEKERIKVELDDDLLTIHAKRYDKDASEIKKKYVSEICYADYTRSFTLPSNVDERKIEAKFENGVLMIIAPKTEEVRRKQIPIY